MPKRIKNPINFSLCRNCNHYYLSHTTDTWTPSKCGNIINDDKFAPCECLEFVPKGNIEYLEWKYEHGKLERKSSKKGTKSRQVK